MVGPLQRIGRYLRYHRGRGRYSRYSPQRDAKIKARHGSLTGLIGRGVYRHTHDYSEPEKVKSSRFGGTMPLSALKLLEREHERASREAARQREGSDYWDKAGMRDSSLELGERNREARDFMKNMLREMRGY